MREMTKQQLLVAGAELVRRWCEINGIPAVPIAEYSLEDWRFDVCAYYRPTTIHICLAKCAPIGTAGRAWSFPGYTVDRTPYGVVAHELGHHVDRSRGQKKGAYFSDYALDVQLSLGSPEPMTTYCPNAAEWFAEMFRLFVTNPDLLRLIRPKVYERLIADGYRPAFEDTWEQRLAGAPERTIAAARRKVQAAAQCEL